MLSSSSFTAMIPAPPDALPVLITGATGYIGGRLARWLLQRGWRVRCLVRSRQKLAMREWADDPRLEIVEVALDDAEALKEAMRGCGAAFYLIHSMAVQGGDFHRRDLELASGFALAAAAAGLTRIIYLGGLGETGDDLSEHLASRREVEVALASGPVPVTTLRAAIIIGSGSASFEMLRYLVERLPVMITPRWVRTECQPIAVRNVLHYLVACLTTPATIGQTLDIGGPDILSYRDLMHIAADELGLRRRIIIAVPVLTPRLSSLWIHLVTPIDRRMARPLAEGLRNRVVCRDQRVIEMMPQPLLDVRSAIALAIGKSAADDIETSWSDAGVIPGDPDWAGGTLLSDRRELVVDAEPAAVFRACSRIGGDNGWYSTDWLWWLRGVFDRLVGGPGLRRGRRDQERLIVGDAVDFWRVIGIEKDRRLELVAEMRLPGRARLEWTIEPLGDSRRCRLVQNARFQPRGLWGLLYWYSVSPLHIFVFPGLIRGIAEAAKREQVKR
jgi:uncharacterized protein YbjT (DUF2867 family)